MWKLFLEVKLNSYSSRVLHLAIWKEWRVRIFFPVAQKPKWLKQANYAGAAKRNWEVKKQLQSRLYLGAHWCQQESSLLISWLCLHPFLPSGLVPLSDGFSLYKSKIAFIAADLYLSPQHPNRNRASLPPWFQHQHLAHGACWSQPWPGRIECFEWPDEGFVSILSKETCEPSPCFQGGRIHGTWGQGKCPATALLCVWCPGCPCSHPLPTTTVFCSLKNSWGHFFPFPATSFQNSILITIPKGARLSVWRQDLGPLPASRPAVYIPFIKCILFFKVHWAPTMCYYEFLGLLIISG